jgi:hemerythrin
MQKIDWDSHRFETGHHQIDAQHRQLVALINSLVDQLDQPGDILNDLVRLVQYAKEHFHYEEEVLEAAGYSALQRQYDCHNRYIDKMDEFISHSTTIRRQQITAYLLEWWEQHILIEDMAYKGKI